MSIGDRARLADELRADKGFNRALDARVAVALYSDSGHVDLRDDTHARLPSKSDECALGTYWISAFSGLSLRTAPDYTSDRTLKRLALEALSPSPDAGLREALEKCRDKFREYERLHRAKIKEGPFYAHTNEEAKAKANRNADMAEMCEAALYYAALRSRSIEDSTDGQG